MKKRLGLTVLVMALLAAFLAWQAVPMTLAGDDKVVLVGGGNPTKDLDDFVTNAEVTGAGNLWYVNSNQATGASGDGKNWDYAFLTLDEAVSAATENNGDVINVAAGHAENIALTTTIDIDVAGVRIRGFGQGDNRPTLTQTATGAYVDVAADDVTIENILFLAGVNTGTAAMLQIQADDCTVEKCEFRNVSDALHTNHFIETSATSNAADRLIIRNCRFYAVSTDADCDSAISIPGVQDSVLIERNLIVGTFDDAGIHNPTGKICTNLLIKNNVIENTQANDWAIELVSDCTGTIVGNALYTDAEATALDPGACWCIENYVTTAADASGMLIPAPDSGLAAINDTTLALIEAEATDAIEGDGLDHMCQLDGGTHVYPDSPANESIVAYMLSKSSTAAVTSYDNTTDSLEAIADDATNSGTYLLVQSSVTSSEIPNNTQTAGAITGASSGTLLLVNIFANTDATGLATPTNIEFSVDNAAGLTGAGAPIAVEAIAGLGASVCWNAETDATSNSLPLYLETGKKVFIHGDDAAGTGAGVASFTLLFQRISDAATIAGADLAP